MANVTTTELTVEKINDKRSLASIYIVVKDDEIEDLEDVDGIKIIFNRVIKKNYKTEIDFDIIIKPILIKRAKNAWTSLTIAQDASNAAVIEAINASIKESFDNFINKKG